MTVPKTSKNDRMFIYLLIFLKYICIIYCRNQAALIAKTTSCKGSYPLQKLTCHNSVNQTVPDAMHTIKDAIEIFLSHCWKMIVQRDYGF